MAEAEGAGCEIVLPADVVVTREFREGAASETVPIAAVPPDGMILDVGSETCARIEAALGASRTLVWNGPLGRLRDRSLRPRHERMRARCRPAHRGRRAALRRRRGRHGGGAPGCRRARRLQLRVDRRRAPSSSGWRGGRFRESPRSRRETRERAMSAGRPAIIVHDLDQATAALRASAAAGVPVTLWSAPGAAGYAGLGFLGADLRTGGGCGARGRSRRGRRLQGQPRAGARGAEPELCRRGLRRPGRHAQDAPGHRRRLRRAARHRRAGPGRRSISPTFHPARARQRGLSGESTRETAINGGNGVTPRSGCGHANYPAGQGNSLLVRERQSGHPGQPRAHPDARPPRRHRAHGHPAGGSGLRARARPQLRAQPAGLRSALSTGGSPSTRA